MIDATEDYHPCTVCSTTVHDFGPGADAVCDEDGAWFHKGCVEETRIVGDILTRQLEKSVQQAKCEHVSRINYSSGCFMSGEYFRNFRCPDCNKGWTEYGEPK